MKTNFKRLACVMMSSVIVGSGLGSGKVMSMWPLKTDTLTEAFEESEKIKKKQMADNVKLMGDALKIFCEHETYNELNSNQKITIQKFLKTALKGPNVFGFDFEANKDSYTLLNPMKNFSNAVAEANASASPIAKKANYKINPFAVYICETHFKEYFKQNSDYYDQDAGTINFDRIDNSSDKDRIYSFAYTETKDLFKHVIMNRISGIKGELDKSPMAMVKNVIKNPLFIIFAASVSIRYGAEAFDSIRSLVTELSYYAQKMYNKATAKKLDIEHYQEILDRIETRLRTELVGQDEAIDRVIDIMRGYFQSMLEAKAQGKKFEGGLMLYLTGSPATGKSTMMKIIQEEMHLDNFEAKMSDVVEDKGNGAESVAARLTKPVVTKTRFKEIYVQTLLMMQLNQHNPTLYAFDEIDKMRKLDRQLQGNKSELGNIDSIDEILRNFIDTGHLAGVDASGSIVIVTSNETDEDIMRLEPSLRNRYSQYRVKFRDFEKEDYKEIIRRGSVELQKHYADTFNTEVKWNEDALDYFATKFVEEQAGGRCAEPLMMKVRSAIAVLCKSTDIKNKILSINVSEGENKHIVIDVLGDAAVSDEQKTVNE